MKNIALTILLIIPGIIYSQNNMEIVWQACFGGSEEDYAVDIVPAENGYLIYGKTKSDDGDVQSGNHGNGDVWIVKIDTIGNLIWEKCYGGSQLDIPGNIIKVNNNYYLGIWTHSNDGDVQSGNHGGGDRWIVKIDENGDILWEKCYGGSMTEYGGKLKHLSNGNIMTYGATFSGDGDVPINYGFLDVWLMIITPDGEILQNEVFGNIGQNNGFDIIETQDGGFFMASKVQELEGMVQGEYHGWTDVWALKLDPDLNIQWQKLYGGSGLDYGLYGVLELGDGYIFLASTDSEDGDVSGFHTLSYLEIKSDIWVVKIDSIGEIIWEKCVGGYNRDYPATLHQTEDGGFVIFASTSSTSGDVSGNHSILDYDDIWMVKLSSEGEIEWQQCYGGERDERINYGIYKKSDHNWIVAGRAEADTYDVDCRDELYYSEDFWVFEIKDCDIYSPVIPEVPIGPDSVCTLNNNQSIYNVNASINSWDYQWLLQPDTAGTITGNGTEGIITWNENFEGTAKILTRSFNDCGFSDWSPTKDVYISPCLGIEDYYVARLKVYPNPTKDHITFEVQGSNLKGDYNNNEIQIANIIGLEIAILSLMPNKTVWDTWAIPAGIYFYSAVIDDEVFSGRIVVQK